MESLPLPTRQNTSEFIYNEAADDARSVVENASSVCTTSITEEGNKRRRRVKAFSRSSEVPLSTRAYTKRAGVIPYCVTARGIWFMVGVDAENGELTDFGGHRKPCESIEATAARELFEESAKLIDIRRNARDNLSTSPLVTDGETCIFFLRVDESCVGSVDTLPLLFSRAREILKSPRAGLYYENSVIYWIHESDLVSLTSRRRIPIVQHPKWCISESDVSVPEWMLNTRGALLRISPIKPAGDTSVYHPNVYPAIKRLIRAGLQVFDSKN